jgi:hypothetical protein
VQVIVSPLLSKAAEIDEVDEEESQKTKDLQMAHGSLEDGILNSSVGSLPSGLSTLTTPQVEEDSAIERSSGINASPPSVNRGSFAYRFSARDLDSISRYRGELETAMSAHPKVGNKVPTSKPTQLSKSAHQYELPWKNLGIYVRDL